METQDTLFDNEAYEGDLFEQHLKLVSETLGGDHPEISKIEKEHFVTRLLDNVSAIRCRYMRIKYEYLGEECVAQGFYDGWECEHKPEEVLESPSYHAESGGVKYLPYVKTAVNRHANCPVFSHAESPEAVLLDYIDDDTSGNHINIDSIKEVAVYSDNYSQMLTFIQENFQDSTHNDYRLDKVAVQQLQEVFENTVIEPEIIYSE